MHLGSLAYRQLHKKNVSANNWIPLPKVYWCGICFHKNTVRHTARTTVSWPKHHVVASSCGHIVGGARGQNLSLQWRHNDPDGASDDQTPDCLLNRLVRHRSKKTPKLRFTGLSVGNSPVIDEFPAQRASNIKNVSIWWCHHVLITFIFLKFKSG